MSVEQASPSVSSKAASAAEGRSSVAKVKAGANQAAGDAAPGGFMALVATFDAPDAVTNLPSDAATATPSSLSEPADATDKGAATDVPWVDLSMLLGQKMLPAIQEPAPTDAQASAVALDVTDEQSLATLQMPALMVLPMPISVSAPTQGLPATEVNKSALPSGAGALAAPYPPGAKPVTLPAPNAADQSKADHLVVASATQSLLPETTNQGLGVLSRKAGSTPPLGVANSAAETQLLRPTTFMDLVVKEPALSGALLSSGVGAEVLNQATRAASKPVLGLGSTGVEGSFAQYALVPGGGAESTNAAAAALSPESAVAEQVTYWVSQGIQNAQLKLEGFGSEAVEVTISLKGQEAQIDFRTDQPEVRQMLEGALTQLKDTLAREGVVLSGVSVGASGQEGAGAQDRRPRPSLRQTTVRMPEASPTASLQRAVPAAGRALDVFV